MKTLQEIADALGLSQSTVSRVLNGKSHVAASTRQKVVAALEAAGYRPNLTARDLVARRWGNPAAYHRHRTFAYLRGPLNRFKFAGYELSVAQQYCKDRRYALVDQEVASSEQLSLVERVLWARGVEGIVLGTGFPEELRTRPIFREIPTVCAAPPHRSPVLHSVFGDAFNRLYLAGKIVVERGYRRIGIALIHDIDNSYSDRRRAAFLLLRDTYGRDRFVDPVVVEMTDGEMGAQTEAFLRWTEESKPDAIIAHNPWFYWVLIERGSKVPEDIAFVALNLSRSNLENDAPLSGFQRDRGRQISVAFRALEHLASDPNLLGESLIEVVLHPPWREGKTLPDRTGQSVSK